MNYRKKFFITLIIFIIPSIGYCREVDLSDLYRCNKYFCMDDRGQESFRQNMRARIGVIVPPRGNVPYQIRRVIIHTNGEVTESPRASDPSEATAQPGTSPEDSLAKEEKDPYGNGQQPFNMASNGEQGGQAAQQPLTNTGSNGGPEVRGGIPIVDDSKGKSSIEQPKANTNSLANNINPTSLNAGTTGKSVTSDAGGGGAVGAIGGGGAGLPNSPGNYESGGGGAPVGKGGKDSYLAALEDIADGLGNDDSFLNGGGAKGVAGSFVDFVKKSAKRLAQVGSNKENGEQLAGINLNKVYDQYTSGARVPASLQQFSNPNASPFRNYVYCLGKFGAKRKTWR